MTIEIGVVSEADRQAALAALIEHAADRDEPGAWIAETAALLMAEGSEQPRSILRGSRPLTDESVTET